MRRSADGELGGAALRHHLGEHQREHAVLEPGGTGGCVDLVGQFPGALHLAGRAFDAGEPHLLALDGHVELFAGQARNVDLQGHGLVILRHRGALAGQGALHEALQGEISGGGGTGAIGGAADDGGEEHVGTP